MNWYSIFYWLTVANNLKIFFIACMSLFSLFSVVSFVCYVGGRDEWDFKITKIGEYGKKWFKWSTPFAVLFWLLFLLTPTKSDTLLIIAGGSVGNFITSDSSSVAIPSEITKFIHLKLQEEIASSNDEIKRQFGLETPKEKLLRNVKEMTKEQIIEYLKTDTTVVKQ